MWAYMNWMDATIQGRPAVLKMLCDITGREPGQVNGIAWTSKADCERDMKLCKACCRLIDKPCPPCWQENLALPVGEQIYAMAKQ